jgi:hypothetical protein
MPPVTGQGRSLAGPGNLAGTLAAFSGGLAAGGLLILEPWYTPETWQPSQVQVTHHRDTTMTVVRVAYGHRNGRIDFRTVIGTTEGLHTFEECYAFTLHTEAVMAAALRAAGFTGVRKEAASGFGRGLWVARK